MPGERAAGSRIQRFASRAKAVSDSADPCASRTISWAIRAATGLGPVRPVNVAASQVAVSRST